MLSAVIAVGITKAIGGAASSNGGGAPSAGTSGAGGIGTGAFGLSMELQLGLAPAGMTSRLRPERRYSRPVGTRGVVDCRIVGVVLGVREVVLVELMKVLRKQKSQQISGMK